MPAMASRTVHTTVGPGAGSCPPAAACPATPSAAQHTASPAPRASRGTPRVGDNRAPVTPLQPNARKQLGLHLVELPGDGLVGGLSPGGRHVLRDADRDGQVGQPALGALDVLEGLDVVLGAPCPGRGADAWL